MYKRAASREHTRDDDDDVCHVYIYGEEYSIII